MIARTKIYYKHRLSKTTIMTIRSLARNGKDEQLEDFIYRVVMNYIAEVRNTDYVDEEDYLKVKDRVYECECPQCGQTFTLDFETMMKGEEK